ncbi:hypothetical protein BZG36_03611 [Bifiguratus adelaidae]|uniref:1-phosphatidylinositol 4-kinase n=1 Tax=Bifiguratus adelaidae TaxID=1938954 RepID=A0A261Y016_9FUNG|nr:hypothetical protein BZG36_03611 [Bifiguratus adelaidae]
METCPRCAETGGNKDIWLQCDGCETWFHAACLGVSAADCETFDNWYCEDCIDAHGPITYKQAPRKSARQHSKINYADLNEGMVGDQRVWSKLLAGKKLSDASFARLHGSLFTIDWVRVHGLQEPVIFPHPEGLDMSMPDPALSVRDVAQLVGKHTPVEVIDVASQSELVGWALGQWADYFHSEERDRIRNVISLEISHSELGRQIERPKIVRDLDWFNMAWPSDLRDKDYPKVQLYCLMSVAGSYTDFHIDFGGTSVFYHILSGEKEFYFIRPTATNLKKYQKWSSSPDQSTTFLGDEVKDCVRVKLEAGNTMIIPTGWIHAVHTPKDSVVIGGNFLHSMNIATQLAIYAIERETNVPPKFRFPYYETMNWYVAFQYTQLDEGNIPDRIHPAKVAQDLLQLVRSQASLRDTPLTEPNRAFIGAELKVKLKIPKRKEGGGGGGIKIKLPSAHPSSLGLPIIPLKNTMTDSSLSRDCQDTPSMSPSPKPLVKTTGHNIDDDYVFDDWHDDDQDHVIDPQDDEEYREESLKRPHSPDKAKDQTKDVSAATAVESSEKEAVKKVKKMKRIASVELTNMYMSSVANYVQQKGKETKSGRWLCYILGTHCICELLVDSPAVARRYSTRIHIWTFYLFVLAINLIDCHVAVYFFLLYGAHNIGIKIMYLHDGMLFSILRCRVISHCNLLIDHLEATHGRSMAAQDMDLLARVEIPDTNIAASRRLSCQVPNHCLNDLPIATTRHEDSLLVKYLATLELKCPNATEMSFERSQLFATVHIKYFNHVVVATNDNHFVVKLEGSDQTRFGGVKEGGHFATMMPIGFDVVASLKVVPIECSMSLHDHPIVQAVWGGKLPIVFTLRTETPCEPFFLEVSRSSYLPLLTSQIRAYFAETANIAAEKEEEIWYDYRGIPLKWHFPIGLLYDIHTVDADTFVRAADIPWPVTVHYDGFPSDKLIRGQTMDSVQDFFMSMVKESDYLRNGSTKKVMNLSKQDQSQLWEGLLLDNTSKFWSINARLIAVEGQLPRHIPMRIYLPGNSPVIQEAIVPADPEGSVLLSEEEIIALTFIVAGTVYSFRQVLAQILPDLFATDASNEPASLEETPSKTNRLSVILHGIEAHLDVPITWASHHAQPLIHVYKPASIFGIEKDALLVSGQDVASTLQPFVYDALDNFPCTRLLNDSMSIGCQSLNTPTGILYAVHSQADLTDFINGVHGRGNEKYAVIVRYELLSSENLNALAQSKRMAGVLAVVNGTIPNDVARPAQFSPDSTCPNCEVGLYANDPAQYQWNPQGTGLMFKSFNFPIFGGAASNAASDYQDYPLQAVNFDSFMWAAVDTTTCLRRGWCSPNGGLSVYSTPSLDLSANDGKPIIVVSAAMDSRSIFHDLTLGVESSVSGTIAVLAIAEALSHASIPGKAYSPTPLSQLSKHILYTLFNGEAWAHAGSMRFVHDISQPFTCQAQNTSSSVYCAYDNPGCAYPCVRDTDFKKINFQKIDTVVEINSVAFTNGSTANGFYIHSDNIGSTGNQAWAQALSSISSSQPTQHQVSLASAGSVDHKLPPSSVQSFLLQNRNINSVYISGYKDQMTSYQGSDFDDAFDMTTATSAICAIANTTARSVWLQAQGLPSNASVPPQIAANCNLVSTLLDCLTTNYSCSYTNQFLNVSGIGRFSHYSSIFDGNPSLLSLLSFNILGNLTGIRHNTPCGNITACQPGDYCIAEQCVSTLTRYHDAYGLGLVMNQDGSFSVANHSLGTWTESTWDPTALNIFSVTAKTMQIIELVVGILYTLLSVVVVLPDLHTRILAQLADALAACPADQCEAEASRLLERCPSLPTEHEADTDDEAKQHPIVFTKRQQQSLAAFARYVSFSSARQQGLYVPKLFDFLHSLPKYQFEPDLNWKEHSPANNITHTITKYLLRIAALNSELTDTIHKSLWSYVDQLMQVLQASDDERICLFVMPSLYGLCRALQETPYIWKPAHFNFLVQNLRPIIQGELLNRMRDALTNTLTSDEVSPYCRQVLKKHSEITPLSNNKIIDEILLMLRNVLARVLVHMTMEREHKNEADDGTRDYLQSNGTLSTKKKDPFDLTFQEVWERVVQERSQTHANAKAEGDASSNLHEQLDKNLRGIYVMSMGYFEDIKYYVEKNRDQGNDDATPSIDVYWRDIMASSLQLAGLCSIYMHQLDDAVLSRMNDCLFFVPKVPELDLQMAALDVATMLAVNFNHLHGVATASIRRFLTTPSAIFDYKIQTPNKTSIRDYAVLRMSQAIHGKTPSQCIKIATSNLYSLLNHVTVLYRDRRIANGVNGNAVPENGSIEKALLDNPSETHQWSEHEKEQVCANAVSALSGIVCYLKDDQLTASAFSMLVQLRRSAPMSLTSVILTKLVDIALISTKPIFKEIIDLYAILSKEPVTSENKVISSTVANCQLRLAQRVRDRPEIELLYLHNLLNLFVEKGNSIQRVIAKNGKVQLNSMAAELGLLLPVLKALLLHPSFNPHLDANEETVSLYRNTWFHCILYGFVTESMWYREWQESIGILASKTPPLVLESAVNYMDSDLEYNSVLRRGFSDQDLLTMRNTLSNLLPTHAKEIYYFTFPQIVFLLAVYYIETMRSRRGNCTFVLRYFMNDGVNKSKLVGCLDTIADKVIATFISEARARTTIRATDDDLRDQARQLLILCCHRLHKVHQLSLKYSDILFENFPTLLCDKNLTTLLLELVQLVWLSCDGEYRDEFCPVYEYTSPKVNVTLHLGDSYAYRKEVMSTFTEKAKRWLFIALNRAPHEMTGLLQDYLADFDIYLSGQPIDTVHMGRSLALDVGRAAVQTQPGILHAPRVQNAFFDNASVFVSGFVTRRHFRGEVTGVERYLSWQATEGQDGEGIPNGHPLLKSNVPVIKKQLKTMLQHAKDRNFIMAEEMNQALHRAASVLNDMTFVDEELVKYLVWIPVHSFSPESMRIATSVWNWILTENPKAEKKLMVEIATAWNWCQRHRKGVFSPVMDTRHAFNNKMTYTPSDKGIRDKNFRLASILFEPHLKWIQFLHGRFNSIRYRSRVLVDLVFRMMSTSFANYHLLSNHAMSRECRFELVLLGFKILHSSQFEALCEYQFRTNVYRAALDWFTYSPRWYYGAKKTAMIAEYRLLSNLYDVVKSDQLNLDKVVSSSLAKKSNSSVASGLYMLAADKTKDDIVRSHQEHKKVLMLFFESEINRMAVWMNPLNGPGVGNSANFLTAVEKSLVTDEQWSSIIQSAWNIMPKLTVQLPSRFTQPIIQNEVQRRIAASPMEVVDSAEALMLLLGDRYNRSSGIDLKYLMYWAPVPPITATNYFSAAYGNSPLILQYAMRSLEYFPVETVFFYVPQVVQALRHDDLGYVERYILEAGKISQLFAHQIIWNMKANFYVDADKDCEKPDPLKPTLETVIDKLVHSFTGEDKAFYEREFKFFGEVTSISGTLKEYIRLGQNEKKPMQKKRLDEELSKIIVDVGVYLPSNPDGHVVDIDRKGGKPLQSHAKAPFLANFLVEKECGDTEEMRRALIRAGDASLIDDDEPKTTQVWQGAIFKVGDDCRQDVLALQLIAVFKNIFTSVGLDLYVFPYRIVATAPGNGVIDVIPNSISRDQLGREKVNSMYDYFVTKYGGTESIRFQKARNNFIQSVAAYSVIVYLLQIKDRHNGNIMLDDDGHMIHIDFGFILDIAPGGITFESAPFKLTTEMIQVMGGGSEVQQYKWFMELVIKAYLASRPYAEQIIQLVSLMLDSGLPCFKPDTIRQAQMGHKRLRCPKGFLSKDIKLPQLFSIRKQTDVDFFYGQVEQLYDPTLANHPFGIQQKHIIVTCNYAARQRGVRKLQLVTEAKKCCPELVIVNGENLDRYRACSKRIFRLVRDIVWDQKVERLGMDELFMDVTGMINAHMADIEVEDGDNRSQLYFRLKPGEVHSMSYRGLEDRDTSGFWYTPRTWVGYKIDSSGDYKYDASRIPALDNENRKESDKMSVERLHVATHLAKYIRDAIHQQLGFTCSAGVARSKIVAKLVADAHKPNAQTVITPDAEYAFMNAVQVRKIMGFGWKSLKQLCEVYGQDGTEGSVEVREKERALDIRSTPLNQSQKRENEISGEWENLKMTVGFLRQRASLEDFCKIFDPSKAEKLWDLLQGKDDSQVVPTPVIPTQISIEDSFLHCNNFDEAFERLLSLSVDLIHRLETDLIDYEKQAWLRYPTTLRLTTRVRHGQQGWRDKRESKSCRMPVDIFERERISVEDRAKSLVQKSLLPTLKRMVREPFDLSLFNIAAVNLSSTKPHASISGFFDTLTTHANHVDPLSASESISPTRHPETSPQTELKRPSHVPEDVWRELPEAIKKELIHYGSEALAPEENSASEDRKRRRLEG